MAGVTLKLTQSDISIVKYQIGREKVRFLSVAQRCKFSNPLVIAQDPFFTRGILFPTLYHLSCPRLVKLVSYLEASPFFKEFKRSAVSGGESGGRYRALMRVYQRDIAERINSLYINDGSGPLIRNYELVVEGASEPENFADNNSGEVNKTVAARELYEGLIAGGLAGSREVSAVKCLHALYGFLIGCGRRDEEVLYFRSVIEEKLRNERGSEFADIFGG